MLQKIRASSSGLFFFNDVGCRPGSKSWKTSRSRCWFAKAKMRPVLVMTMATAIARFIVPDATIRVQMIRIASHDWTEKTKVCSLVT